MSDDFNKLKPFRFWCQKVLPLVYDNSLSYYELLCKVVDYLNKTMEDVNSVIDLTESFTTEQTAAYAAFTASINATVASLTESFNTLQAFVDNYFDNLDVQEEINNKLDLMASDGTLSDMVRPVATAMIPGLVAQWLEDNITPTTPVVDRTLTVIGAAADARETGYRLAWFGDSYAWTNNTQIDVLSGVQVGNQNYASTAKTRGTINDIIGIRAISGIPDAHAIALYKDGEYVGFFTYGIISGTAGYYYIAPGGATVTSIDHDEYAISWFKNTDYPNYDWIFRRPKMAIDIYALKDALDLILVPTANLCNVPVGRYYVQSNVIVPSPDTWIGTSKIIPCEPETPYVFSCFDNGVSTVSRLYVQWWDNGGNYISSDSINRAGTTFHYSYTSPSNAAYMSMFVYNSAGISGSTKLMISQGATNPTAYIPPYVTVDTKARDQINALSDSVSLIRFGTVTQAWLTTNGYTSLTDLPTGRIYEIPPSVEISGKPANLVGTSFSFVSIRSRQTALAYAVMFAIGRTAAYYALGYDGDTVPAWVNFDNPIQDETLSTRWGTTAEIVLLGDSIVQGVGSSDYSATGDTIITIDGVTFKRNVGTKAWGAKFKAKLESEYHGLTVIDNGLEGKGIGAITDNLDSLVTANTKVAIVCVGVNSRSASATTIQTAYTALFNAIRAKGIKPLALSSIDVNGASYNTSLALINTALERACRSTETPYYNLYGEYNAVLNANTKADYYADTLHPNDKGYATMFGLICKLLNF